MKRKYFTVLTPRFLYAIIISLFLYSNTFAQSTIEISGQVKGEDNGEHLMYCSVTVLNLSDSLVTGGITNEKGYFYIPVKPGKYKLALSYMGYVSDTIEIGLLNNSKFVGIIKMKKDSQSLDEVEVKASSRGSTIDKDVQIVTDELRKGASDAKEVLEKLPGLSYDRYNNTISVDNSSNVVFLVDGVEKNQEYIKNLPPERLKKIEVIRNPGGRYGLEGYSAIINIILRKDYTGQELFLYDQLLVDPDRKKNEYTIPLNSFIANYTYTFNKINLYTSIYNHIENFALETSNKTTYNDGIVLEENSINGNTPNMFYNGRSTDYTFGMDYYINPRNTLSFEGSINSLPPATQKNETQLKTSVFDSTQLIKNYDYSIFQNRESKDCDASIFYVGKLSNKDRLDFSFNYYYYNQTYDNKTGSDSIWRNETGTNKKHFTKFNMEYNREFNSKLSTQLGYSNTWKKLDNSFIVNSYDTTNNSTSLFEQTDLRNNFYGYISYVFNKKLSMKTGIAGEFSNPKTSDQNNHYFIYQPYFDIKYNLGKKSSIKAMFRSASEYPSIQETNPFSSRIDPTTITTGNPNLKPSVTYTASLKFSYMHGLISLEPYYKFSYNYISQTGYLKPDGIFEYTFDNIGHYEDMGIQTNFTIPFGKMFVWQNSIRVYHSKISHDDFNNNLTDWNADSKFIYTGMKNKGIILLQYRKSMGKMINAMGYNRNYNDYWLFIYQQPFLKNHFTAMIGYMLPVNWGVNYNQDKFIQSNGYEKYSNVDISILKNMLLFKITYRFSKGKIKKMDKRIDTEKESSGSGIF